MFCFSATILGSLLVCGIDAHEAETIALVRKLQGRVQVSQGRVTAIGLFSKESTAAIVPRLAHLPMLNSLGISHVELGVDDFKEIGKLSNLTELVLTRCGVHDNSLRSLTGLSKLTTLGIRENPITDDGLQHLTALKSLKILHLSRTNITGVGLSQLTNTATLEYLRMSGTPCDDRAMEYLEKCKMLKELDISGTKITGEGVMRLVNFHQLIRIGADDALQREVEKKFHDAHVASKRTARQRGEEVPADFHSPFVPLREKKPKSVR